MHFQLEDKFSFKDHANYAKKNINFQNDKRVVKVEKWDAVLHLAANSKLNFISFEERYVPFPILIIRRDMR